MYSNPQDHRHHEEDQLMQVSVPQTNIATGSLPLQSALPCRSRLMGGRAERLSGLQQSRGQMMGLDALSYMRSASNCLTRLHRLSTSNNESTYMHLNRVASIITCSCLGRARTLYSSRLAFSQVIIPGSWGLRGFAEGEMSFRSPGAKIRWCCWS
jgi:hypothetical protein